MPQIRKIDGVPVKKYRNNPFLEHTAEISTTGWHPRYSNPDGGIAVFMQDTGEIKGASIIYREEVEKNQFLKVYAEGIGALFKLKAAGQKVFMIIYNQLIGKKGVGKTEIILSYELLTPEEQLLMGKRSFNRGINECIKAGLIAQSYVQAIYFVNPACIFNGNRLNIVKQYIIKQEKEPTIVEGETETTYLP